MKKLMKRIGAVLMAVAMMAALGVSAWAAKADALPDPSDTGTITIKNVDSTATVTAYKIVKATYDVNAQGARNANYKGFTGYELVVAGSIADIEKPTEDEIKALVEKAGSGKALGAGTPLQVGSDEDEDGIADFTATLEVGEYLILVTGGTGETVYNPMVASVYYSGSDDTRISGVVDATTKWKINGTETYAKSTDITVDKKITGATHDSSITNPNGIDIAIGDIVDFEIDTVIPAYSKEYTEVVFNVKDELDKGLDLQKKAGTEDYDITVTVGGAAVDAANYEITGTSARGFTVEFKSAYLLSLKNASADARKVVVSYKAQLTDAATVNFDENNNKATVEYTNNPDTTQDTKEITDETHQYTFEIDGNIAGEQTGYVHRMHELVKTDENGVPEGVKEVIDDGTIKDDNMTTVNPLAGAIFELKNNATNQTYYAISDNSGLFGSSTSVKYNDQDIKGFRGLDAGTYTLKEVQAPNGYTLDSSTHTVEITTTINADTGILESYTIKIDGTATTTYTATYDADDPIIVEDVTEASEQSTFIKNVKTSTLPSTGGIGTYVFTVAGVAIMAIAAGLLIVRHKKKAE